MKRILFLTAVFSVLLSCSKADVDVLVVGGGTAGTVAAISSARTGASTMLIERGPSLGGTTTNGGVCFPGLFHAWGKQIIGGTGWELVKEAVEFDRGSFPDFTKDPGNEHYLHQIVVNAPVYSALAEEKCIEKGVDIRYYTSPISIKRRLSGGWKVMIHDEDGVSKVTASVIVDCTGDASAAGMAGCERIREEETQPGSLIFNFEGFDPAAVDYSMVDSLMDDARRKGLLTMDHCYSSAFALLNQGPGVARSHVRTCETRTRSEANITGRRQLLELVRFLHTIPGLEGLKVKTMLAETALRETYRIKGEYTITVEDYVTGRDYPDAVANSFYPIDLHDANGVIPQKLEEGVFGKIPLRALVPEGSRRLIVAGRCVSADREALSALRVQASCMAMGDAAGAVAALAAMRGCAILDVPAEDINRMTDYTKFK